MIPAVRVPGSLLLAACVAGCATPAPAPLTALAWPEADALFRRDPRWLGADAALSVDLRNDTTLWLFGDTFVAKGDPATRRNSVMVRNSIAIQRGRDPRDASITMHWGAGPGSFFPEDGAVWHWPGHGVRLGADGPLVLFLLRVRATPGEGLGFAGAGWRIVVIDAPEQPPAQWRPRWLAPPPAPFDAVVGTAVVEEGAHLIAVAIREAGVHAGHLARFHTDDLRAGRARAPEWWQGGRWVAQDALHGPPDVVLPDAGAECSLHFDPRRGRWLHVASRGFGATTIAVRESHALTGPWSGPVDVFTPPESRSARPFVYAAKAHPELRAPHPGEVLLTYAANSFEFGDLFTPEGERGLYWPRFVRLRVR